MPRPNLFMADAQASETLALELQAEREAAGALEERVNAARRAITASYVAAFGSTDAPAVPGPELDNLLEGARRSITEAMDGQGEAAAQLIERYTRSATQLGTEHAAEVVEEASTLDAPAPDLRGAGEATSIVGAARSGALAVLTKATMLSAGYLGAMAAVGGATKGVNGLRALARTVVNEAHSRGVREVTEGHHYGRVWVAERDGCVHCLAYAGVIAWEGESFPLGRTFADKPSTWATELPDPPLHPHCRCQTLPHLERFGSAFPDALAREARRSVAKGWRVESESQAVRLRAAENLLQRGADLPASVQEGARRSLARGKFPDRRVPVYTP